MTPAELSTNTKQMIDDIKTVCANYGLGNAASESKIITQIFLYKFLNDKFLYEAKKLNPDFLKFNDDEYQIMLFGMNPNVAKFNKNQLLSDLYTHKDEKDFHTTFDKTITSIAENNASIFSVSAGSEDKIKLFENLSQYVIESEKKDAFCRAMMDKIVDFSFEDVFEQKYDFFAQIFEYLIKDYNKDFGKYAEYYTPNVIARIIARILVKDSVSNVKIYDPAAGSGTLLLALAHQIGEDNCSIYSQDISQKSNEFLRLNLILNNLVHSLQNIVHDDTLVTPRHLNAAKNDIAHFDYIVSNPPFKTDFSETRDTLASENYKKRFWAGVPNIPATKKESMAIYLMFMQHIIASLNENGKAAIVVPTGFLTAQSKIEKTIREELCVKHHWLRGVVSMPSNIFATTGTNVSIIIIDKQNTSDKVMLMDASKLGEKVKEDGKNQKTVLKPEEIEKIVNTFNNEEVVDDFSILVSYEDLAKKNCSFSAGQYFEVKIDYVELTPEQFKEKMDGFKSNLNSFFEEGHKLEDEIKNQLNKLGI